jgi:hypothetical protein
MESIIAIGQLVKKIYEQFGKYTCNVEDELELPIWQCGVNNLVLPLGKVGKWMWKVFFFLQFGAKFHLSL